MPRHFSCHSILVAFVEKLVTTCTRAQLFVMMWGYRGELRREITCVPKLFSFEKFLFKFRWRRCEMVLSLEKRLNCTISFKLVKGWSATINDAREARWKICITYLFHDKLAFRVCIETVSISEHNPYADHKASLLPDGSHKAFKFCCCASQRAFIRCWE